MAKEIIRDLAAKAYLEKSGALSGSPSSLDAMSDEDFDKLDKGTKRQLMNHYHLGMAKSSDPLLRAQIKNAFDAGMALEDLIMVLVKIDEPFLDDPDLVIIRKAMEDQGLQVWAAVTHREAFATRLEHFGRSDEKYKTYAKACEVITGDPRPHYMWIVMMAGGMISYGEVKVTQDDPPAGLETK